MGNLKKDTPMFPRIKKSGKCQYIQIVENRREEGKTKLYSSLKDWERNNAPYRVFNSVQQ